jgi:predicted nucleic acid-binding protein
VISLDSNILVYAATEGTDERHAHAAALVRQAVRSRRCIQSLQSLAEFYNAATRRIGITPDRAAAIVAGWQQFVRVEAANLADLDHAMRATREYRLSFWDALIWATVRRVSVAVLVSEDFQDGRVIEGVRIANPFNAANVETIDAALRY